MLFMYWYCPPQTGLQPLPSSVEEKGRGPFRNQNQWDTKGCVGPKSRKGRGPQAKTETETMKSLTPPWNL